MSTKYRYLKNLRSTEIFPLDKPHEFQTNVPQEIDTKSKFRAWSAEISTDHVFYSLAEGSNPHERVTKCDENPVNRIHGLVADYDATVEYDKIAEIIDMRVGLDGFKPTWASRTRSGYARLIWEFEEPIPVAPEIAKPFLNKLASMVNAAGLLAGYDKTSTEPSRYFELGTNWVSLGGGLPRAALRTALFAAADSSPITTTDIHIPIAEVAAEVEARWPGRWPGEFNVGARGPLFWINDGIDRVGCQVREDGLICYSDRAGKGFMSWRDLFGGKFISKYEQKKIGEGIDNFWFNGKDYFKLLDDNPVKISTTQLILELKRKGFSAKPKKGQSLSEVEAAMLAISDHNRVDEVAPIVFSNDRVVRFQGHTILNNCKTVPVPPAPDGDPSKWPFLKSFLDPFFCHDSEGDPTLPYFYAWFQRFYRAALNHNLVQGQLLILLGDTGRGKSFLTNQIISRAVGGFADAGAYLAGMTAFNKELCRHAAWVIDDAVAGATYADQRRFAEMTKRAVANPRLEYQAKYADTVGLPWAGRVLMSLNMDANSLASLPPLDSSNRDKVLALRVSPTAKFEFKSNEENEATVAKELPHFLRWLLDYSPPPHTVANSRFGVVSYIDPLIEGAAYDNSSRSAIAEMVEFFARRVREHLDEGAPPVWRGTLTEFQVLLHELNAGRPVGQSNNLEFVRRGMTVLEEVGRAHSNIRPVRSYGAGGGKIWEINLEEQYDLERLLAHL